MNVMRGSIQLTTEHQTQIKPINHALDTTQETEQLDELARQLMQTRQTQKSATYWVLQQRKHLFTRGGMSSQSLHPMPKIHLFSVSNEPSTLHNRLTSRLKVDGVQATHG